MIDETTKILFGKFPREMGIPYKIPVYSWRDVERVVVENNGIRDIFISLYDTRYFTIDKIMFDLDFLDLKMAGEFYRFLVEKGFKVVPLFSGKKGFHFYVVLKPYRFKDLDLAKATLRRVCYHLVDEAGFYKKVEKHGEIYKISLLDSSVFGDLRRSARMPNTLRPPENVTYATYLPEDFYNMSWEEFFEWVKHTHYDMKYDLRTDMTIVDIETSDVIYDYISIPQVTHSQIKSIEDTLIKDQDTKNLYKYLSKILRPCLLKAIFQEDPPHMVRTAATIDLMWAGFSVEDITQIYSKIGWADFKWDYTKRQVQEIFKKGLLPFSCKKLKMMGLCDLPLDEWCDFWD